MIRDLTHEEPRRLILWPTDDGPLEIHEGLDGGVTLLALLPDGAIKEANGRWRLCVDLDATMVERLRGFLRAIT